MSVFVDYRVIYRNIPSNLLKGLHWTLRRVKWTEYLVQTKLTVKEMKLWGKILKKHIIDVSKSKANHMGNYIYIVIYHKSYI